MKSSVIPDGSYMINGLSWPIWEPITELANQKWGGGHPNLKVQAHTYITAIVMAAAGAVHALSHVNKW